MSSNLQDSIVRITSSNPGESDFGTGFVIFRDAQAVYVLTCAHVVNAVGGSESVKAGGFPVSVVALGSENDIDLAVLSVNALQDRPVLHLGACGQTGSNFTTVGFQQEDKLYITPVIEGVLGDHVGVEASDSSEYLDAWFLEITNDILLKRGNSGSPVVDKKCGKVIAVVTHLQDEGKKGFALSIKALTKIWRENEIPVALLKEIKAAPFSETEDSNKSEEVFAPGTPAYLLTQEEREKLITLLCELPNINYANVRHSLVSTLPARFQGNIAYQEPAKTQITEIVDVISSDASFQLLNGSYPVIILIQNALKMVKKPQLKEELQLLLNNLKDPIGVVPQIKAASTSLDSFIQYLENFILQMPAIQFELRRISASFNAYICQRDCDNLNTHLVDVCSPIPEFSTFIQQFHDSRIISDRFPLMEALQDFSKQAEMVQNNISNFCMKYGSVLERDQPGAQREKIQQQLNKLRLKFYESALKEAEALKINLR